MITFLLSILFDIVSLAFLSKINTSLYEAILTDSPNTFAFMNTQTYVFYGIFMLIQSLVMVYVLSFFMAGYFGMLKNVVKDGSTIFREFYPEMKRHWYAMFRLQLVKMLFMLLIGVLFFYGMIQFVGTTPGFLSPEQQIIIAVSVIVAVVLFAIVTFLLLFSESIIVLEDAEALESMKGSLSFISKNLGRALATFFTVIGILVIAALIVFTLSALIHLLLSPYGTTGITIATVLNFLLLIILFAGGIIASTFIVKNYADKKRTR